MVNQMPSFFSLDAIAGHLMQMSKDNLLSTTINKKPTMFLLNLPANFEGEEEIHSNEDDLYIILEGEAVLLVDINKAHLIKKGDIIHIPKKIKHKLVHTKEGIKYIVVRIKDAR